ncbi:type II toxin-antitoxin system VapB family antitoxin [Gloeobacter morelensis]|uniref:Type II toxin-antitoxin system VapB family antitoxin n=1 Tax=Gloeobacter morelensis MG652769 TaxID=2781736 RepID=A0ABY3PRV0_9CYAN|nr:type II toxin-antitoxin system VapB family antitoxin [Gloeobacter morelensis]UFP96351.1 type II toxin-antitoxin system VapB family antitoxin [Gloeobacter morelensis MG652769]
MQQINIKSDKAYRMANELSRLTGESVTQAITQAIEERLEKIRAQARSRREGIAERLLALGTRSVALPILDPRAPDEILYDENGLPKNPMAAR